MTYIFFSVDARIVGVPTLVGFSITASRGHSRTFSIDNPMATDIPSNNDYRVRSLLPDDAPGVVACVRQVYGDSYVHPEFYDAAAIVRLNESQQLVSAVALDPTGAVVGQYALERPDMRPIAETGVAVVLPEHRHHQLMERMREVLEQVAARLELIGLYGHAVTNHTFSQHVDERFHEEPCAVSLGWSPRTFHNLAEPLPQRMTDLLYFKYLRKPEPVTVHLPEHHAEQCLRIYEEIGVRVIAGKPAPTIGPGQITVDVRRDLGRAVLRVQTVGENSSETIVSLTDDFAGNRTEVIFLELPLAQPGTPALCRTAERLGYFFSGLGPSFAADGDALRLQKLNVPLNPSLILAESQHARDLLAYVIEERNRTDFQSVPACIRA